MFINSGNAEERNSQDLETILQYETEDHSYSRIKYFIYSLIDLCVPKNPLSIWCAAVFIIFSFIQMLSLLIIESQNRTPSFFGEVLRAFRILPLILYTESKIAYFCWIGFIFILSLILIICAFLALLNSRNAKSHINNTAMAYICAYFTMPLFWVGIIPVTDTLLSIWNCSQNIIFNYNICWTAGYDILFVFSIICTILYLLIFIMISVASGHSHPYNNNPLVHFPWFFEPTYAIIRIFLVFRSLNFWSDKFGPYVVQTTNIIFGIYFFSVIIGNMPYYNEMISFIFCGCIFTTIGSTLFCLIYAIFSSNDSSGEFFIYAIIAILGFIFAKIHQSAYYTKLFSSKEYNKTKDYSLIANIIYNILITGENYGSISLVFLKGFINNNYAHDENLLTDDSFESGINKKEVQSNIKKLIICILNNRDPDNLIEAKIMLGRAYLHLMGNTFNACKKIFEAEANSTGFFLGFEIYKLKIDIQEFLNKSKLHREKKGHGDFYSVLQYELTYNDFCNLLKKTAVNRMAFWTNLTGRPDLNKIQELGLEIMRTNREVVNSWKTLTHIYPDHEEALLIYLSFLNNITGWATEADELAQKINKNSAAKRNEDFKANKLFSLDSATVIVSHTNDHKTKILRTSSNIKQVFGYSNKNLINRDLSILMPRIIGRSHAKFMEENLMRGRYTNDGFYEAFGLHSNGYIFPIRVSSQQIFSLKFGLLYAGNIQKLESDEDNNFIITDENGKIDGITRELGEILNINPYTVYQEEKIIQSYCPTLKDRNIKDLSGSMKLEFLVMQKDLVNNANLLAEMEGLQKMAKKRTSFCTKHDEIVQILTRCEIKKEHFPVTNLTLIIFKFPTIKVQTPDDFKSTSLKISPDLVKLIDEDSKMILKTPHTKNSVYAADEIAFQNLDLLRIDTPTKMIEDSYKKSASRAEFSRHAFPLDSSSKHADIHNVKSTFRTNEDTQCMSEVKLIRKGTQSGKKRENVKHASQVSSEGSKSRGSISSDIIRQKVAFMQKLHYESFYPTSIYRLKLAILIFSILLIAALSCRVGLAVYLNERFASFAKLMLYNSRRISSIGKIGKNTRELTLFYTDNRTGRPLMNDEIRYRQFNYSTLLPSEYGQRVSSYKTYLIEGIKYEANSLMESQLYTQRHIDGFSPVNTEMVEPSSIAMSYYPSPNYVKFPNEPMSTGFFKVISHSWMFVTSFENGIRDLQTEVCAYFLIENNFQILIRTSRYARDGIVAEYGNSKDTLNSWSFNLLMIVVSILIVFMLVIFPFLLLAHREQSNMLLMLTRISKTDIKKQVDNITDFLRDLRIRMLTEKSNSLTEDDSTLNINRSPSNYVEEESCENIDKNQNEEKKDNSPLSSKLHRSSHKIAEIYTPLKNKSWKVFILFSIFCGFMLGMYMFYNSLSISLTDSLIYQATELFVITRGSYYCSFNIGYFYHYAYTNRTGLCGMSPCVSYMLTRITERQKEVNTLMIFHKRNSSMMTEKYNKLFNDIFEGNPCKTVDYFKKQPDCETVLNGMIKNGVYAATINFIALQKAIKAEFETKFLDIYGIEKYMNDQRLIELEIINEKYLAPSYTLLGTQIVNDAREITSSNNVVAIWFFISIICELFICSFFGGKWVIEHLRRSIFNTKYMLANIPPSILKSNKFLAQYLMISSK